MGTVAGLIVILLTAVNPVGTAIGFVLATVAMIVVLLAYLWLDRWEPEPPRLLVLAFLWGASVAVVVSVVLELVFGSLLGHRRGGDRRVRHPRDRRPADRGGRQGRSSC